MKKLMSIVIVIVMMLSMAVFLVADSSIEFYQANTSASSSYRYPNGEPASGAESFPNVTQFYLQLNGDVVRQSAILGFFRALEGANNQDINSIAQSFTLSHIEESEIAIYKSNSRYYNGLIIYTYAFFPKDTAFSNVAAVKNTGSLMNFCYYYRIGDGGWPVSACYLQSFAYNTGQEPSGMLSSLADTEELIYYTGEFVDGTVLDGNIDYIEDGDYIAPAFEFLCFGGKAPDEDGFVRATGLIVDGMDQLSLCFPYLYYKIYPGSNPLNNYELRIYEDSMFSENHTLRARITYPEMKDLEVDKTYTYIQSINTYFPIGKNTKYWLTIYDRKAGQAVYTLPVETSAMAKMQANVEHFHIYQVQDGNTVGNPDDYNYEGFFDPFDDIIGGWEPDVPEGDWNEPVPGQIDWGNIGEIDEWFNKMGSLPSNFVGYIANYFTYIPGEIWVLIGIGIALSIMLRIFGR